MTVQRGDVTAFVPGWTSPLGVGIQAPPSMLLFPDELIFFEGAATSPPSAQMQEDMGMLSRKPGLDPRK